MTQQRYDEALALLKRLVSTQSYSRQEGDTAVIVADWLRERGAEPERYGNNVVAWHRSSIPGAPALMLNSHHDTVRPGNGWLTDPFDPVVQDGRLTGLGSNDAGGALVVLLAAFIALLDHTDLPYTICMAATAEEEISGSDGMAMLVRQWMADGVDIAVAIVGEPTGMNMAIAEKGLVVLDCTARGRTGHAAREEGENAIYGAIRDIEWFRTFTFDRVSPMLGPVKMTVTQIEAGNQHNVVPDECRFVVDVRTTDAYVNGEIVDIIRDHVRCDVVPRSLRLQPSSIVETHPLVIAGKRVGMTTYGSPTLSDQSLLPPGVPSLKIGPGDSARSHTPNEYLHLDELRHGVDVMIRWIELFMETT